MVFIAVIRRLPGGLGAKTSKVRLGHGVGSIQKTATCHQLSTYSTQWSKRATSHIMFGSSNLQTMRSRGYGTFPFANRLAGFGSARSNNLDSAPFSTSTVASASLYCDAKSPADTNTDGTSQVQPKRKKVTLKTLASKFKRGDKLSMVTAYDFPTAQLADQAGMDLILVGDSLGMVVQGKSGTESVTLEDMVYHTSMVSRAAKSCLVVGDMPFGSYLTPDDGAAAAVRLVKEGLCHAVKLEGGNARIASTASAIIESGVAVMGHVGLTPQSANALGGFTVQGRTAASAKRLLDECIALQEAGAFAIVLEMVPHQVASYVTSRLTVPTIGIGCGSGTSGQVLVMHDMIGLYDHPPKFVKKYASIGRMARKALVQYREDVEAGIFPVNGTHGTAMKSKQLDAFYRLCGENICENSAHHEAARCTDPLMESDKFSPTSNMISFKNVAIIGGGSMGNLIAQRISAANPDVSVHIVSSRQYYVDAVADGHVKVSSDTGGNPSLLNFEPTSFQAIHRTNTMAACADLCIILTKSAGTADAARVAAKLSGNGGFVLSLQNGMGNLGHIKEAMGTLECVLAGVTSHSAFTSQEKEQICIVHSGTGSTFVAPAHDSPAAAAATTGVSALLSRSGIETTAMESTDLAAMQWSKLAVNAAINPLTALLNVPNGQLLQHSMAGASGRTTDLGDSSEHEPLTYPIMRKVIHEVCAVGAASGIFETDKVEEQSGILFNRAVEVCRLTSQNISSMLSDLREEQWQGTTEISVLNGFVSDEGRRMRVPTPVNDAMTALIKCLSLQKQQASSDTRQSTIPQQYATPAAPVVLSSIASWRKFRQEIKHFQSKNVACDESSNRINDPTVGFVPTMGGLHQGHLDLVRKARAECDFVVVSIFVNPKQFAKHEDLDSYPMSMESDLALLSGLADAVFAPSSPAEVYPPDFHSNIDVSSFLNGKAEHERRPHFFNGVATVCTKLFNIIQPDKAYFGQKDGLQCAVIRRIVRDLCIPVDIVVCPTVREADGLAMSTRNQYLSSSERAKAPLLHSALNEMKALYVTSMIATADGKSSCSLPTVAAMKDVAAAVVRSDPSFSLEYISVSSLDGDELVDHPDDVSGTVAICSQDSRPFGPNEVEQGVMLSIAAMLGETRLIDNVILQGPLPQLQSEYLSTPDK